MDGDVKRHHHRKRVSLPTSLLESHLRERYMLVY